MFGPVTTLSISIFLAQHVAPPPAPPVTARTLPDYSLLDAVNHLPGAGSGLGLASLPDGDDIQVNSASTAAQTNSVILVDPKDRKHLIAAANDTRSGHYECCYYASFDGGATWVENFFPDPDNFGNALTPAIAFAPNGVTYYAANAIKVSNGDTAIYVGTSTDGGLTIPTWLQVIGPGSNHQDDKPSLAVDNTGGTYDGTVYLTFTRFGLGGISPIYITTSSDGGVSWSTEIQLSDNQVCQGSCPVVGNGGELYCCFYDFFDNSIKLDKSFDGGVTWGVDVLAAKGKWLYTVPNTVFKTNSLPAMDVDRSGGFYTGALYICFACDKAKGTLSDVYVTHSYDGGVTWTKLFMVNDFPGNSQFFPALQVDPTGHVNVAWMDRRNDLADVAIDYYCSRSDDGGITWEANTRVSDTSFDPNSYPQGNYLGSYMGIAASERMVYPMWVDGRNGDNDVFISPVNLDFRTDIEQISAATGATPNFTLDAGSSLSFSDYRILGSVTGTNPGIKLNGVPIPVNYDQFTLLTILYANTASFPGFFGVTASGGLASASMVVPPVGPSLIGLQFDFAAFVKVSGKVKWASSATHLEIVP
jgi:hypothetical protein